MEYLQVAAGLALLVFAGDILVRGSVVMAKRLGLSTLAIGLTVVAFGTSAPELMVGIDAVVTGAPTIAIGNVIGSNIANVWLVIGLPAVLAPMVCTAPRFRSNTFFMIIASFIMLALAYLGKITWISGIILLALLALFIYASARRRDEAKNYATALSEVEGVPDRFNTLAASIVMVLIGLGGLMWGAHMLVQGSVEVARNWGVSEAVIGLTVIAIGTSLPELVTATVAALRGQCEVAIGNVIGSNIFNILGILGVTSLFGTIPVPDHIADFDIWVMILAALSLLPFAYFGWRVGRSSGLAFCIAYVGYIVLLAHNAQSPVMDIVFTNG